jgi:hypothetical protein
MARNRNLDVRPSHPPPRRDSGTDPPPCGNEGGNGNGRGERERGRWMAGSALGVDSLQPRAVSAGREKIGSQVREGKGSQDRKEGEPMHGWCIH